MDLFILRSSRCTTDPYMLVARIWCLLERRVSEVME